MDPKVLAFLSIERVCSLTTLKADGTPHASAVHFSHNPEPLEIYFGTENTTVKVESLLAGQPGPASVAIGFSEKDWLTFQADGEIEIISDPTELEKIHQIHYRKHPDTEQYKDSPTTVFLKFTPSWWRFSDYNADPPLIVRNQ